MDKGLNILVVDDDVAIRKLFERILKKEDTGVIGYVCGDSS